MLHAHTHTRTHTQTTHLHPFKVDQFNFIESDYERRLVTHVDKTVGGRLQQHCTSVGHSMKANNKQEQQTIMIEDTGRVWVENLGPTTCIPGNKLKGALKRKSTRTNVYGKIIAKRALFLCSVTRNGSVSAVRLIDHNSNTFRGCYIDQSDLRFESGSEIQKNMTSVSEHL